MVAADGAGNFVTVWLSANQNNVGNGVFGQRFATDVIFRDGFQ
jgi:hypothetical protein